ncbi:MAG TPA: YXWGXW repeat-containing protein [Kofleriaceae bacterium]|nr:YXWGXW repeat-containing protein [Kofleriaceae bacterium]
MLALRIGAIVMFISVPVLADRLAASIRAAHISVRRAVGSGRPTHLHALAVRLAFVRGGIDMSAKTWLAAAMVLLIGGGSVASADRWRDRRDCREDRERREERASHRHAPPAMRAERYAPRRGFVWVNGYWDWRGDNYVWVSGHYERERRGYRWRDRRWEERDDGWVAVDGGWVTAGPASAPPAVRVESYDTRPGFVWVRGNWD